MESEPSSEVKLRHQLDIQARQINKVLSHHRIPATVVGGEVLPQAISFNLQTQISAGMEKIRGLKGEVMSALGVGDVAITQDNGRWRLRVARPDDPPVPLLRLLASIPQLPRRAAILGLAEGGQPVHLRFPTNRMSHVLIAGEPGAGKTSLLRTIAASLALTNRQSEMQLQILDPRSEQEMRLGGHDAPLLPLGYLPHMLTDPALNPEKCVSILHFLAEEMTYRRREFIQTPRIVVLIDHPVTLLEHAAETTRSDLLRLLQYGSQAGIHLVLATDRPESPLLDAIVRGGMAMRIVGRLRDDSVAARVAGIRLDMAALLYGEGDFLAVTGKEVTYFQAAYIGDYDLHLKLMEIYQSARPTLLARPYSTRPRVEKQSKKSASPQSFTLRDGVIDLDAEPLHTRPPNAEGDVENDTDPLPF